MHREQLPMRRWCGRRQQTRHEENNVGSARECVSTKRQDMRLDWTMRVTLGVIAISLAALAFRPVASPPVVKASADAFPFYVEPGVEMLRYPDGSAQVYGKVVVDLRTGK